MRSARLSHLIAASIVLATLSGPVARAQTPEVRASIEAAFESITATRKKLLTCTVTVPEVVTKVGAFINSDRKFALEEMTKAGFDPAFIEAMRVKTDPDLIIDWKAEIGQLIPYCIGAIDLLHSAITDPRYVDAVRESLAASP
jgi:hypothetical protein